MCAPMGGAAACCAAGWLAAPRAVPEGPEGVAGPAGCPNAGLGSIPGTAAEEGLKSMGSAARRCSAAATSAALGRAMRGRADAAAAAPGVPEVGRDVDALEAPLDALTKLKSSSIVQTQRQIRDTARWPLVVNVWPALYSHKQSMMPFQYTYNNIRAS